MASPERRRLRCVPDRHLADTPKRWTVVALGGSGGEGASANQAVEVLHCLLWNLDRFVRMTWWLDDHHVVRFDERIGSLDPLSLIHI